MLQQLLSDFQGFVANVWAQLALGLLLLVVGWKMNANSANGVLFLAWVILAGCVFRSPWVIDRDLIVRALVTMCFAGLFGLVIHATLWTPAASVSKKDNRSVVTDPDGLVEWTFDGFLGGSGSGSSDPFRVMSFQARGKNVSQGPIIKVDARIEIDNTNERFPVRINYKGVAMEVSPDEFIPSGKRFRVHAHFTQEAWSPEWSKVSSSWKGYDSKLFLERFAPFTFVVSVNDKTESRHHFSRERIIEVIEAFFASVRQGEAAREDDL